MNRRERLLVFFLLFVAGMAPSKVPAENQRRRPAIQWPSLEFRDLQSAIDAAPDEALIEISNGTHNLDRPVFVRGPKRLTIKGAGSGRNRTDPDQPVTRLVGPPPRPVLDDRGNLVFRADAVEGLWNFLGANVTIQDMALSGFDAGIVSKPDDRGNSGPTVIKDVVITETGRGILSLSFSELSVEDCTITETLWNGISFGPAFIVNPESLPQLTATGMTIADPNGAGIYFENTFAVIDGVSVFGADAGGIVGSASVSFIDNSFLVNNEKAGILLAGGFSEMEDNQIIGTKEQDGIFLGDGIALWSVDQQMVAELFNNSVIGSERAGISLFGATATLGDNFIGCSNFDLFAADHESFTFELNDVGENQCICGMDEACDAKGEGLEPPPPIGGLE